ncbi:MAG: isoprenylcysteine carboxylmethyltransferase family protein [Burkholderiales bacterium]|nr:isoprenylcysteine carboxylmethyltransferase family protein [Burkholderiales bacterium]
MVQLLRYGRGQVTLVDVGNALFRWRNTLFPFACALVFLPGPRVFADPIDALAPGAAIAFLGQLVRSMTIGLRYIIRGGRNRRVYAEDLVTEGLYAHTRNPMYIGNLLILAGVALASNSWVCLAIAVPLFVFVYVAIVAAEENFLRAKFGTSFDAYRRNVPRWSVRWRDFGKTLGSMEFNWRRVLVKEYGTPVGWITGLCALGLIRLQSPDVAAAYPRATTLLYSILIVAVLAWLTARWLKKARIVVAD